MKIAIIGSGIAGLTCAHLLARQHAVTVFESASWIGGHTHTVDVRLHGRDYAVDTGFIVFNDWTYPNFIKLLGQLGVRYKPTEMSFSVCDPQRDLEYNGHSLNTLFAQRSNLLSPPFWGMLRDILRFNREALDDYHNGRITPQVTLGSYLRLGRYNQRFIDHYIVPMGAAIWSMPPADMLEFPLEFFIRFCKNHGLLSVNDRPQWYVVEGGSSAYVSPLTKGFSQHIRLNCPVFEVLRDEHGVTIQSPAGAERFAKRLSSPATATRRCACWHSRARRNATSSAPSATPVTTWCCTPISACCPGARVPGPAGTTVSADRASSRQPSPTT